MEKTRMPMSLVTVAGKTKYQVTRLVLPCMSLCDSVEAAKLLAFN